MTVKFMVRTKFSDGNLKERMLAENLPEVLEFKRAQQGRIERIEYECSSGLCLALMRAGCDTDMTRWDAATLEYKKLIGC